jgi:hypothetical protein
VYHCTWLYFGRRVDGRFGIDTLDCICCRHALAPSRIEPDRRGNMNGDAACATMSQRRILTGEVLR